MRDKIVELLAEIAGTDGVDFMMADVAWVLREFVRLDRETLGDDTADQPMVKAIHSEIISLSNHAIIHAANVTAIITRRRAP